MSWTAERLSFKKLINRRVTDDNKAYYEEFGDSTLDISIGDIFGEQIPFDDPSLGISNGVVQQYTEFLLKEDITVSNNQSYFACTDPSQPFDLSKSDDPTNPRLKNWISDKYGNSYRAKLLDNNNNEIFPTDSSEWFFDYKTGIVIFNGNVNNTFYPKPFKITGYRYIGKTLDQVISDNSGGGGGELSLEKFIPDDTFNHGNSDPDSEDTGIITVLEYVGRVFLFINQSYYNISKTDINDDAYFSKDGGVTATGDTVNASIYWNSLSVGFDLNSTTDEVVVIGQVSSVSGTPNPPSGELIRVGVPVTSNRFLWNGSSYDELLRYEVTGSIIGSMFAISFSTIGINLFESFQAEITNGNDVYKLPYYDGTNNLFPSYNKVTNVFTLNGDVSSFNGWTIRIIIYYT